MPIRQRKDSKEEVRRRGEEIYQQKVRPLVEEGNRGKFVAIDVDSEAFEMGDDFMTACKRLFARLPDAQAWYFRIGYPAGGRFSDVPPRYIWYNSADLPSDSRGDPVMPIRQPKYSSEEYARRGDEIYQQKVRPLVEEGNHGKIVAIDIDTGAFEVDDNMVAADTRLFARFPDAQIWYVRIGYPYVDRLLYMPPEES